MQLKKVLKIVQMIDNECQVLNKELERRRAGVRRGRCAPRLGHLRRRGALHDRLLGLKRT